MKWTPQAIVAVLLGLFLILSATYRFTMSLFGVATTAEGMELWVGLLQFIAGGLLTWIGTSQGSDDR